MLKLKEELRNDLCNKKVSKIVQFDKFSFSIFFGKQNLFFTINPEMPIVYITSIKENSPNITHNFALILKKFLLNACLSDIKQLSFDRILVFEFWRINELGDRIDTKLIIEMMGKHSNIFLTEKDYKIIDTLKKFSIDENSFRIIMPGFYYKRPVLKEKIAPFNVTKDFFENNIKSPKDIIEKIEGFGKYSATEVYSSFEKFKSFLERETIPTIYTKNDIITASFFELDFFSDCEKQTFSDIKSMLDCYIEITIKSHRMITLSGKLEKIVEHELKKNRKIIEALYEDKKESQNYEKLKQIGDILAANLYKVKYGMNSIELFDFYNEENIIINLIPDISPAENLNRIYKKYEKTKKGFFVASERLKKIEELIQYFETIKLYIENAETFEELLLIERELIEYGYLKSTVKPPKKNYKTEYKEFTSSTGTKIIVGRNNIENDIITFKIALKDDIWLHAKNIPGSHVIIKKDENFSETVILEAAQIAAFYSKAKNETKVAVDYTFRKYVNKPKGANPGFVSYKNEKTVFVNPNLIKKGGF